MEIPDYGALEDTIVAQLQNAVTAGLLTDAIPLAFENELRTALTRAQDGGAFAAVIAGSDSFDRPKTAPPDQVQEGVISWTVLIASRRLRGPRSARRGSFGAYEGIKSAIQYLDAFEVLPGQPLWYDGKNPIEWDDPAWSVYALGFSHQSEVISE